MVLWYTGLFFRYQGLTLVKTITKENAVLFLTHAYPFSQACLVSDRDKLAVNTLYIMAVVMARTSLNIGNRNGLQSSLKIPSESTTVSLSAESGNILRVPTDWKSV